MVFGIYGATRTIELTKLQTKDVEEKDDIFFVKLERTKTDEDRNFVIEGLFADIVRKYRRLRPENTPHNRFFVNYQKGVCTVQPIGKHKFSGTPKTIALFLELDGPDEYTGHSYLRSSATLAAGAGATTLMLKQHAGWRSSTVAEDYVENSITNKRKMAKLISDCIVPKKIASTATSTNATVCHPAMQIEDENSYLQSEVVLSQISFMEANELAQAESASDAMPIILSQNILAQSNTVNIDKNVFATKAMKTIQIDNCSKFTINFNFGTNPLNKENNSKKLMEVERF